MPWRELILPDLGIDDQPITLSLWLVKQGAYVSEGEPLVEVLCGAATVDLPAPIQGILFKKLVAEDEILQTGQTLALIQPPDE